MTDQPQKSVGNCASAGTPSSATDNVVIWRNGAGLMLSRLSDFFANIFLYNSPAFTGTPTAPTPADNTNNTQIATTQYLDRLRGAVNGVATLDGSGKLPSSQLTASVQGALDYQGQWDASGNTPLITSSVGTKGQFYTVSVAGTTAIDGVSTWSVGDHIAFNGTKWEKFGGVSSQVTSVAGRTGAVVLAVADVSGAAAAPIVSNKTVSFSVASADRETTFVCTNAITASLSLASALGSGFRVKFKNANSNAIVTVATTSPDLINGAASIALAPGESCEVVCDGTTFSTMLRPGIILLSSGALSNAANLTLVLPSGFDTLDLRVSDLKPVTNAATLQAQFSQNLGSTWLTTATYTYAFRFESATPSIGNGGSTAASSIQVLGSVDNTVTGSHLRATFPRVPEGSVYSTMTFEGTYDASGAFIHYSGAGRWADIHINAVKLFFSSGNISQADYQLYGMRR